MSFGIYPTFKPSLNLPDQFYFEGAELLEALEKFDKLAVRGGVALLSSFADMRDVPDDFDGDPDELQEILGPWEEWFDVKSGLKTCEFLLAPTQKKSKQLSVAYEELEILRNALTHASENGISLFRLEASS